MQRENVDAEGRIAVGGNATFTNFGVNDKGTTDTPATASLVFGEPELHEWERTSYTAAPSWRD